MSVDKRVLPIGKANLNHSPFPEGLISSVEVIEMIHTGTDSDRTVAD
jgi:hypothetical protein